jgi:hypothetical protein
MIAAGARGGSAATRAQIVRSDKGHGLRRKMASSLGVRVGGAHVQLMG